MLHELLFALTGHTGDIFILNENNDISVAKNLPFIHPTEESTLNKLCYLANCYLKLKTFIEETNDYFDGSAGLYARSFARGLELCLEPYQRSIMDLENKLLSDPYLTFATVVAKTEEYQRLFPALVRLAEEVSHNKVYGCAILDMLYKASICGMPTVKKAIHKILQVCHCTMYKQLTSWLLHGLLYKNHNSKNNKARDEFFIHCKDSGEKVGPVEAVADGSKKRTDVQSTCTDDFEINVEMLPGHIPFQTAGKILFIGRSVMIFESSKNGKQGSSIMKNKEEEFMADMKKLSSSESFDLVCFEETIDKVRNYVAEQLWNLMVTQSDLQLHLRQFKDFFLIGRGELFLAFIDQSQDILRNPPIVMTQHDVNLAFQHAARDLSLSEETYQGFGFIIEVPASQTTTSSTTLKHPSTFLNTRESGWNCLRMAATVDWPLHVMFTPNIIKKYVSLFSFLLYVKRIQLELQHCWSIEMSRRHLATFRKLHPNSSALPPEPTSDPSSSTAKWRLRNHMAFLVDNLQYYLQVDVIESQYCLLLEKIKSKKDFEEILLAHEHFLTSLHNQCFFHSKPVFFYLRSGLTSYLGFSETTPSVVLLMKALDYQLLNNFCTSLKISSCLSRILELCHAFYGLMTYSESILSQAERNQLQEISKEFELNSSLLFKLLSSFRNNQASSPHLAQLLLRIDYNKFFSHIQHSPNTQA